MKMIQFTCARHNDERTDKEEKPSIIFAFYSEKERENRTAAFNQLVQLMNDVIDVVRFWFNMVPSYVLAENASDVRTSLSVLYQAIVDAKRMFISIHFVFIFFRIFASSLSLIQHQWNWRWDRLCVPVYRQFIVYHEQFTGTLFFFFFIFLSQFHSSVIHSFCRWSICLIWSCLMIKVHANVLCVLHDTYKFWLFPKAAIKFMAKRVRERKEI